MHVVVIRDVALKYPWAARSLCSAFARAKEIALAKLTGMGTLPVTLPWAFSEAEKAMKLMGRDYWPYGVEANRHVLETMLRYAKEQGLCLPRITVDGLFPATIAE